MNWYLMAFKKYSQFTGRSRRSEYWYFILFNFIITILLQAFEHGDSMHLGTLSSLYSLAIIIPGIAVSIRRLHDTGRSGWTLLFALIPIVGAVILIIFFALDSDECSNEYGENPKEENL